mmetsp:Transcript_48684/g.96392  ORF Transcript_48684/g.96392 Transcript_48684/m.96392 type:complete len:225 (+) Transcript_48684:210-884(+)
MTAPSSINKDKSRYLTGNPKGECPGNTRRAAETVPTRHTKTAGIEIKQLLGRVAAAAVKKCVATTKPQAFDLHGFPSVLSAKKATHIQTTSRMKNAREKVAEVRRKGTLGHESTNKAAPKSRLENSTPPNMTRECMAPNPTPAARAEEWSHTGSFTPAAYLSPPPSSRPLAVCRHVLGFVGVAAALLLSSQFDCASCGPSKDPLLLLPVWPCGGHLRRSLLRRS